MLSVSRQIIINTYNDCSSGSWEISTEQIYSRRYSTWHAKYFAGKQAGTPSNAARKRPSWWTAERSSKINVRPLRACTSTVPNRIDSILADVRLSAPLLASDEAAITSDNHQREFWCLETSRANRQAHDAHDITCYYARCNLFRSSKRFPEKKMKYICWVLIRLFRDDSIF